MKARCAALALLLAAAAAAAPGLRLEGGPFRPYRINRAVVADDEGLLGRLELWGLRWDGRADWGETPVLLVVGASEVPYRELLARYHWLCARVGPLPAPRVVNVDHGRQRFLLFALPATLLVAGAIVLEQRGWRTQATPVLQFGAISYVLYVSHPLVLSALGNVQERIPALQSPSAALVWSAFAVAAATCFAWIVHHAFEQPMTKALRRRLVAGQTVRAPAS